MSAHFNEPFSKAVMSLILLVPTKIKWGLSGNIQIFLMLFHSAFETESCVFVTDFYSKRGFASSGANFHLCFMLSHFHGLRFSSLAAEQDGSL